MIQLFLLPSRGVHIASTMGLHNSFKEYGYEAKLNTPSALYERCLLFNKNGTDPVANPIGTPCKKYNRTSNPKFLLSCIGSWKKPWLFIIGVRGTGSSNENDSRVMRFVVTAFESRGAFLRRYSTLLFMLPFVWPFSPPLEVEPFGSNRAFGRRDLGGIELSSASSELSEKYSGARRCLESSGSSLISVFLW